MSRKKIIAGNWKMNVKPSETAALVKAIAEATAAYADKVEIVCCTPAIDVLEAVAAAKGTKIGVGTENCHWEDHGAFTGEISTGMIVDTGATYVITGHSERRQYFGETDETVNKRTTAAIKAGLTCMMCVGETLDEREADLVNEVIGRQLKVGLKGLTAQDAAKLAIDQARKEAELQFRNEVGRFSIDIAEKMMRSRMSDDKAQTELVNKLLDEIEKN